MKRILPSLGRGAVLASHDIGVGTLKRQLFLCTKDASLFRKMTCPAEDNKAGAEAPAFYQYSVL